MANAEIDDNFKPTITAVSSTDGNTPVRLEADENTGRLLVQADIDMVAEGISTSAKQDTLLTELQKKADVTEVQPVYDEGNNIILREMLENLNIPLWYDSATGTLKVSGSGQTFSTITTVGTVTNQTNIGGLAADPMVSNQINQTWAQSIRSILT